MSWFTRKGHQPKKPAHAIGLPPKSQHTQRIEDVIQEHYEHSKETGTNYVIRVFDEDLFNKRLELLDRLIDIQNTDSGRNYNPEIDDIVRALMKDCDINKDGDSNDA